MKMKMAGPVFGLVLATLTACGGGSSPATTPNQVGGATPKAACGAGSRPETGMQGRVSREEHDSGRAAEGYTCNTELVGTYAVENAIGTVGGFKVQRYIDKNGRECAYYDTTLLYPTNALDAAAGVNVIDMSDPTTPVLATQLITPAMLTPHESVVLSQEAGVLAAVAGNPGFYPGVVDVYDLADDCRNPQLRSSALVGFLGHESGMAPDGKTFYSASPGTPTLTAVDISNPLLPIPLWTGNYTSHGLSISNDGNRAYVAAGNSYGVLILDVSEIQARKPNPQVREVGNITWENMTIPQNAIPFTRNGKPYLVEIDEYSSNSAGGSVAANGSVVGAGRIIDISDETRPVVVSDLRLEVHEPENRDLIANDPGAQLPIQGYAGHYCNIPTRVDPDIVACSMIISGLRIFDIRDPAKPREVAYFNAPVSPRITPVFEASNWAMSSPAFVPERKEIWYTDGYSGFYAVRVTNGVW
ncbi:hypothetical protein E4T66_06245 [Sinimarinibacterium sp. CAU 1509]|uniref:LVIVD repeat-containing protein n=1 Tax=Sinimarinibacterium sp. CAU 1509 TaxID=2562283 RepID=UPI0010AD759E|nr:hypothetical protein [Sinimarinibacterium sp. CAU 1509]TJY63295.1 hypothetical protein E4T66_06245 [Sinimarinibacterium sp. CAU 1509]